MFLSLFLFLNVFTVTGLFIKLHITIIENLFHTKQDHSRIFSVFALLFFYSLSYLLTIRLKHPSRIYLSAILLKRGKTVTVLYAILSFSMFVYSVLSTITK